MRFGEWKELAVKAVLQAAKELRGAYAEFSSLLEGDARALELSAEDLQEILGPPVEVLGQVLWDPRRFTKIGPDWEPLNSAIATLVADWWARKAVEYACRYRPGRVAELLSALDEVAGRFRAGTRRLEEGLVRLLEEEGEAVRFVEKRVLSREIGRI